MKRLRQFLRLNTTTVVAEVIKEYVVDRTLEDHAKKCDGEPCPHSINLPGTRQVAAGTRIGSKRARIDLPCPYSTDDAEVQIILLDRLAWRIRDIACLQKFQTKEVMFRLSNQIFAFAHRNPMVVIAEAALPPRGSRAAESP